MKFKRLLSLALIVATVLALLPSAVLPANAASVNLVNPISGSVQGAGYDESAGHYGIDLYPYNYGDPIYAVASGTIMYSCPRNHTSAVQAGDDCCTVKIILDEPITHNGITYVCAFYTHMSSLVYDIYCGSSDTGHPHNWSIVESEALHPHKTYYRCSTCGEIGSYTGGTSYVASCSQCNDTCSCSTSYAGTYVCATESLPLNIRNGHSASSTVIGQIPSGATVTVTAGNGTWAHVTYGGVSGYASMEYLKIPYTTSGAYPVPFKCYPLSDAQHAADAYDAPGGTHIGYIYGTDYCTVKAVYSNGYCLVNVPWEGSTKDVYAYTGAFLNTSCTPTTKVAEQKATTYIRHGSSTELGWIDSGDTIVIVDDSHSTRKQIIYPHTDGTYRCAWVNTSALVHTHTYGAAATCTTAQYCTTCDAQLSPALGHNPGAAATCTTSQTCTRCGAIVGQPTGHTPGAAATCTTAQTCTKCQTILTYPKGHTLGAEATCTTAQTCTVCGATLVSALGHSHIAGTYTDPTHPHKIYNLCVCGDRQDSGTTGIVASCTICYPPTVSVTSVTLNKTSVSINVGDTTTLTATISPSNATNTTVTWTSSDPSVAAVTNGTVSALKAGTATITATTVDGSKTATCIVTVEDNATSYEAYVYTEAKKTVVQGSQFTYTVSFAGSYDGFSFEVASGNGLTVTDITTTNSDINIDEIGSKWMISVLGGLEKNNSEKEKLVTITVQVASDAELGARTLTLSNLNLSNESGDKVSAVKYEYASIEITDQIPGDVNGDGTFDYYDVSKLYAYYRNKSTLPESIDKDINGDGEFNYYDVSKLYAIYRGKSNFN